MSAQATGSERGPNGWDTTERDEVYQRAAAMRAHSPAADEYWARRKFNASVHELTDRQREELATAKRAHFAKLSLAGARAIKRKKAERLRAMAARLEAEASGVDA